ncbi:DUF3168 domain-containing protein [Fuscibacter oryzae]|uniref:DUF3168 domain-containing protein n=1 Tax=Fuscibacter oryzae TaxID=2803939 RepID=A0A8J7MW64_9RHOB|nr:DUF3168 domain-containing protein [Fuscibacter oryzae]MBL4928789.1 DUF3168 domain-containing protein [Fuscibacter oryzae]
MSADLELQKAIRARLVGSPAVIALVPAANILDRHERPAPVPSIVMGETQALDEGVIDRRARVRIYHDLHIWVREPSTEGAKAIAGAVQAAIRSAPFSLGGGYHCPLARISQVRTLRDSNGATSHCVVTVDALVVEVAP